MQISYEQIYDFFNTITVTDTETFAFITVLVLRLLSRKVLFTSRKDNRNC